MKMSKAEKRRERNATKEAKRKKPSTTVDAPGQKRPIPGPPVANDPDARMVFRLGLMDHSGDWSYAELPEPEVELIAASCKGFETLKPGEFMGRPGNKPIPLESLIPKAQQRLVDLGLDIFDRLWELRLGGEERIWGLLDGHVFYLVWWDPGHEVCPAPKKNT